MSLKKLSLEKETLFSLDPQQSKDIAGGAPPSRYRICEYTAYWDACEPTLDRVCETDIDCGTGTCATNCGTCATCNTCATNCGTCGTCATACGQATCDCPVWTDLCSTRERSCFC